MPKIDIAPGLTLTDEQYEIAHHGLAQHAPELGPLRYDQWTSNKWTLVPDAQTGEAYKAELTVYRTATRTVRFNLWFAPDLRGDAEHGPHNHPFDFHSVILDGDGYVEDRYELVNDEVMHTPNVVHHLGDVNKIGRAEYHEVVEVDRGRTLTLMLCGPGMGPWGYLNLDTGEHQDAEVPARFAELLATLNPHQDR
jgi:hypothetical protein